ncbi:MAG: GIY-YIG nuclease family protein [Bacteroidetes bacterium]|nr:GIY-YIG nuclease family protein [Bacteroidota bacterium]
MSFYVYILESATTGRLYIGQTNDLSDRLVRHNSGRNKYTAGKGP